MRPSSAPRRRALALAGLSFYFLASPKAAAALEASTAPVAGAPIFEVRLEPHEVFEVADPARGLEKILKLADKIHVKTRQRIIRRELLFKPGDPYDPAIIAETERTMRLQPTFRRVDIEAVSSSSGPIVIVRTWDAWSLEIVADFKRGGGVNSERVGIADANLLGSAKSVSTAYNRSGNSSNQSLSYHDPLFLGKRLDYQVSGAQSTGSRLYSFAIARPFYSTLVHWSLSGGADYADGPSTIFSGITPAGTVERKAYNVTGTYGYALQATTKRTLRATLGLAQSRADYGVLATQPPPFFVPASEQHTDLTLSGEYQQLNFIKERRIQKLSHVEDLNLGWNVLPSVTYAPYWRGLGATGSRLLPRLTLRKVFGTEYQQYVALRADYSSAYINGGNGMQLATLDMQYFWHFLQRHTLAAHMLLNRGWRLDGGNQLGLGENNGLRGYRSNEFTGNRLLLFSVEDRIFFFENVLKLVDGGGVVFFDSGDAWASEHGLTRQILRSSVGVGLRLAGTRSSANAPVRIDLAKALNDNGSSSRWSLSVQAGASFGPN